jgi:hypothetical protein
VHIGSSWLRTAPNFDFPTIQAKHLLASQDTSFMQTRFFLTELIVAVLHDLFLGFLSVINWFLQAACIFLRLTAVA